MKQDLNFNKNEDANKLLLSELNKQLNLVYQGGGRSKIEKCGTENTSLVIHRVR